MRLLIAAAFALLGVKAATISTNGKCAANGNGNTCLGSKYGDCCSQYGWCGSTDAYCENGCQSGFGTCKGHGSPSSSVATAIKSSSSSKVSSTKAATPSSTQPASKNARCGPEFGGQTCLGSQWGDCCSQYSYCGSTDDYCRPKSCQVGYGKCNPVSSSQSKSSSATSRSSSSSKVSSVSPSLKASSTSTTSSASKTSSSWSSSAVSSSVVASSSASSAISSSSSVVEPTPTPSSSSEGNSATSSVILSSSSVDEPTPTPSPSTMSTSVISSDVVSSSPIPTPTPEPTPTLSPSPSPAPEKRGKTCSNPFYGAGIECPNCFCDPRPDGSGLGLCNDGDYPICNNCKSDADCPAGYGCATYAPRCPNGPGCTTLCGV